MSQKQAKRPYQFIHTDLIEYINTVSFLGKQYFFFFINNCTKLTEIYMDTKKAIGFNISRPITTCTKIYQKKSTLLNI